MTTPVMIMKALLRSDGARPRVTYYDETLGERIELSAIALDNWVSKAANLLIEEYDAGPGTVITLRLPDRHWRTLYWALAIWSVGAAVDLTGSADAEAVISTDAADLADGGVLVSLPVLARRHPGPVPGGALDEAAEIAGYPDVFVAPTTTAPDDPALITDAETIPVAAVVTAAEPGRILVSESGAAFLRRSLAVLAADGSVVLVNGADPDTLARRLAEERVDGT
ncbi:TIGR03089 family protein [Microlunatus sp. GCM10028923]|uniref:TIGR03089 family protein n=1 Tax=Microlunatus sp. GCM10028923 TaxID=3273400 RepID=UPI003614D216